MPWPAAMLPRGTIGRDAARHTRRSADDGRGVAAVGLGQVAGLAAADAHRPKVKT